MPIKNLSDIRRLPRIGKIHLGVWKTSERTGNKYPTPVDYFVVHSQDQSTSPQAEAAFHRCYGDQPRDLDIMFPVNDSAIIFPQWLKAYKPTGLFCKGDGEVATRRGEDGALFDMDCPCELLESGDCKRVGSLVVLLPQVSGLGVWQLDTSSFHSIVQVNSGIAFIKSLTGGRIAMLPLKLRLRPKEVTLNAIDKRTGENKPFKKAVYVLDLLQEQGDLAKLLVVASIPPAMSLKPPSAEVMEQTPPEDLFPELTPPAPDYLAEAETDGPPTITVDDYTPDVDSDDTDEVEVEVEVGEVGEVGKVGVIVVEDEEPPQTGSAPGPDWEETPFTMNDVFEWAKQLGFKTVNVPIILGVKDMKQWEQNGNSWDDAIDALNTFKKKQESHSN